MDKEQAEGPYVCGIAAILGVQMPTGARDLVDHLTHRGPDAVSAWNDGFCSLAHARLSIVGLVNGDQPMSGHLGTTLAANCEIYNHGVIRKDLSQRSWLTDSDAEAILALHERKNRTPLSLDCPISPTLVLSPCTVLHQYFENLFDLPLTVEKCRNHVFYHSDKW